MKYTVELLPRVLFEADNDYPYYQDGEFKKGIPFNYWKPIAQSISDIAFVCLDGDEYRKAGQNGVGTIFIRKTDIPELAEWCDKNLDKANSAE